MTDLDALKRILREAEARGQSSATLDIFDLSAMGAEIESLRQALATEQQARWAAEQDGQHWQELGLDCWLQFSYLRVGHGRDSGGHSTLEALRHSLEETGLIDEKGEVVEHVEAKRHR